MCYRWLWLGYVVILTISCICCMYSIVWWWCNRALYCGLCAITGIMRVVLLLHTVAILLYYVISIVYGYGGCGIMWCVLCLCECVGYDDMVVFVNWFVVNTCVRVSCYTCVCVIILMCIVWIVLCCCGVGVCCYSCYCYYMVLDGGLWYVLLYYYITILPIM